MKVVEAAHGADLEGIDPKVYARRHLLLANMCLSLVLIVATVSSLNVAIPHIAGSSLRPSDTQILWIVDSYALVFAAFLLLAGALGDRFGRKGALLLGLVIFAAMAVLSAEMKDANALIACRAVMGLGAALIMPSTLSLLQSAFPRRERPKAIATWAAFAGAGGAIGPVFGGILLNHYWYGSVFFISAVIAAVAFGIAVFVAPKSKEGASTKLDPQGATLSIVGFASLLFAIIEGPEKGWGHVSVVVAFVVAVVCMVGFVMYERRTDAPMLDMTYFSKPRFAMGSLGIACTFFTTFAMWFSISQYLQYVQGYSALETGVRTLPSAVMMLSVAPRSPRMVAKYGIRTVMAVGAALATSGLLLLSFADRGTSYWYIALCLVLISTGAGSMTPSLSTGILQSVPLDKAGVGSAVNDTTREVGGAVGIALIGSVVTTIYRHSVDSALKVLPPAQAAEARKNVGKAFYESRVAEGSIGADAAAKLRVAVQNAFVDGFHIGMLAAAGVMAVGGAIVVRNLPKRLEAHGGTLVH